MKVSIAFLSAICLVAALQSSLLAMQTNAQGKPSGKSTSKSVPAKKGAPAVRKQATSKAKTPQTKTGEVAVTQAVLAVRDSLLKSGDDIPAYKVVRFSDGKSIDLPTLMSEPAVLVIYHPGSKPAVRALPQIVATATKIKPGIKVYALCVRTEDAQWKVSVKALPALTIPLWDAAGRSDSGMNARKAMGVDAYPTIIISDKDGKVRDAFAGWFSGDRRLAPLLAD